MKGKEELKKMSERKKQNSKPIEEQPFGDILQTMDGFFNQAMRHLYTPQAIPVYQFETKDEYIIEAELPGIKKNQITLDIFQNYIKIGVQEETKDEKKDELNKTVKQSFRYKRADRVVTLPFAVNESDIKASLSQGLLRIRIPNKRKRIQIE